MPLDFDGLEAFYDHLARAIDDAGDDRALFLTKLALLMAHEMDDADKALALIKAAKAE